MAARTRNDFLEFDPHVGFASLDVQSLAFLSAASRWVDATARLGIDLPVRLIEVEPMKAEPAATYREAQGEARLGTLRQWPSELAHMLAEPLDTFFGPGVRNESDAGMTVPVLAPLPVL